ncbi:MAG: S8 family peptidase [Bdellovibrionales bacterium]
MRDKLLLSVLLSGLFSMSAYLVVENFVEGTDYQARLTSLGVPHEIPMDLKKEVKVLLADPAVSKNWGLMGTGGASDIKAHRAWEITQGSREIRVAIIDTGADIKHPDLKNNLWVNNGEIGKDANGKDKTTNGVDDDKNGFVDDVHGWNFVGNNNNLVDHHGHGTHIAGIVGAEGGNGIGISGVAPNVSLMVLKYYDPQSRANDNLTNTIKAIRYAVKMKAHIINYSGGGVEYSAEERKAIEEANREGILFVAAAGNERSNSDISHYYPADYDLPNIISVTAINPNAQVLASSNYGMKTVHIAAPGEGIFSTLPGMKYGIMTGTSQATSFVSGVAALIMAANRSFNFVQVKNQILSTADEISTLRSKTRTSGKLNSWAALAIQPLLPITGIVAQAGNHQAFAAAPQASVEIDNLVTLSTLMKALERQPARKN